MFNSYCKSKGKLLFLIIIVTVFTTSCSFSRRQSLTIGSIDNKMPIYSGRITICFEEVVVGKPFNETVWDNISGPFWDIKESNQIGFTQNYKPQFLLIPVFLVPDTAKTGRNLVNTRIIVPFGRTFTGIFESAVKKSFSDYYICFNDEIRKTIIEQKHPQYILKIRFYSFYVWEQPLNHINFYSKGQIEYYDTDSKLVKEHYFEKNMLRYKLGNVFNTHSMFIKEMNKAINNFSEDIIIDIFKNGESTGVWH